MDSQEIGLFSTVCLYLLTNSQAHIANYYLTVPTIDAKLAEDEGFPFQYQQMAPTSLCLQ